LDSGDLLIFNDSKVVPARVQLTSADIITHKTGKNISFIIGEAEIFFLRQYSDTTFEALVRRGKWFKT
jgi:S-adenosylmethionine:tRNA-ribosyltransferase-isomerase (queuine synthetase)